jgi:hypothetical protein
MRYFALGTKANIKITDDNLTLDDIKRDAITMGIVTQEESNQIREIQRDEFIKPIDIPKQIPQNKEEENDWGDIPSWQSIIDELRINSTKDKW